MNPCDFNCFGHLKDRLKGPRYQDLDSLINAIGVAIQWGNGNGTFNGVSKLHEVWQDIINKQGEY